MLKAVDRGDAHRRRAFGGKNRRRVRRLFSRELIQGLSHEREKTARKKPPLPVDEALESIFAGAKGPLAIEPTPSGAAPSATLAEDISARRTQPPKALSAMDGYALAPATKARAR